MTQHKKYIYANAIESTPFLMFDCVSFQARPLRSSLLFCLAPGKADNKALVLPSLALMRNSNKCQPIHRESIPAPAPPSHHHEIPSQSLLPAVSSHFWTFWEPTLLSLKSLFIWVRNLFILLLFVWYHQSRHLNQIWDNGSDLNSKAQGRWRGKEGYILVMKLWLNYFFPYFNFFIF